MSQTPSKRRTDVRLLEFDTMGRYVPYDAQPSHSQWQFYSLESLSTRGSGAVPPLELGVQITESWNTLTEFTEVEQGL